MDIQDMKDYMATREGIERTLNTSKVKALVGIVGGAIGLVIGGRAYVNGVQRYSTAKAYEKLMPIFDEAMEAAFKKESE